MQFLILAEPPQQRVIVKTVAGFLNSRGSSLVICVTDDGSVVGLAEDYKTLNKRPDRDGYQQFLLNRLANGIGKVPTSASLSVTFHVFNGREVCLLRVTKANDPVYVTEGGKKKFYVRTQNSTQEFDVEQTATFVRTNWRR
jgi:predicted HTH transcriptional regulator